MNVFFKKQSSCGFIAITALWILAILSILVIGVGRQASLEIALTEGYLELKGILSGSKSYGEERLVIGKRDEVDTGTAREEVITYLNDDSWRDEINEFADVIVNGGKIQYGSSSEALRTMKLVYRIYAADADWKAAHQIQAPE